MVADEMEASHLHINTPGGGYGTLKRGVFHELPLALGDFVGSPPSVDKRSPPRLQTLKGCGRWLTTRRWHVSIGAAVLIASWFVILFLRGAYFYQPWRFPRRVDRLIFEEQFDTLDRGVWTLERTLEGGGNGEFQFYTDHPSNVFVRNGMLHLKPGLFQDLGPLRPNDQVSGEFPAMAIMTGGCQPYPGCAELVVKNCTAEGASASEACKKTGGSPRGDIINPVTSGRVNTKGKFSFQYGRLEIRAKMPRGDWLWPALWLLPEDSVYGPWPRSGEIDLCEARGNNRSYVSNEGEPWGINTFASTLHFGNKLLPDGSPELKINPGDGSMIVDGWEDAHAQARRWAWSESRDFAELHTYGLYWAEDRLYTYVVYPDGKEEVVLDLSGGYRNGFWRPPLGRAGSEGWGQESPYSGEAGLASASTSLAAPFDRPFYVVMNVAVGGDTGGNIGYWPSAPWSDGSGGAGTGLSRRRQFWDKRADWLPSWEEAGEATALVVDWVRVWQ